MTISFVDSSGVGVDTGNPVLVLPTGISFGDAVGAIAICSSSQTLTTPAGWTVRSGWPKDGGNARFYAYAKDTVTASDSGASVTFVTSGNNKIIVECFVLHSGNGFPADWTDALNFTAHASGTSYTAPSSTSVAAGDWGVACFGVRGTNPTAWTPAVGTERQDLLRTGSGATSLHLVDSNGSVGGASTTWGPFSETNISTSAGGALTWLVKENASGGGGGGGGGGSVTPPAYNLLEGAFLGATDWQQLINGTVPAGQFRYIVVDWFHAGSDLAQIRAQHPAAKILAYQNMAGMRIGPHSSGRPSSLVTQEEAVAHGTGGDDWRLHKESDGTVITFNDFPELTAAHVGRSSWRTQASSHFAQIKADGFDGVMLDDLNMFPGHGFSEGEANDSTEFASDNAYRDAVTAACGVLKTAADAAGLLLAGNVGGDPWNTDHRTGFTALMTGPKLHVWNRESYHSWSAGTSVIPFDGNSFASLQAMVAEAEAAGVATMAEANELNPVDHWRMLRFGLAAFYLEWGGVTASAYAYSNGAPTGVFDQYRRLAGTPTEAKQLISGTSTDGAWMRHWTGGVTCCNAKTSGAVLFSLGGTYTNPDGVLVSELTLSPGFGAVLLAPGGGVPGTAYPKLGVRRNHSGAGNPISVQAPAAEAIYGRFQGHWGEYYESGSLPVAADLEAAFNAGHDIHIFWKAWDTHWADTAAGGYDTEIDAVAADIAALCSGTGRKVWLTLHHEPEDDTTGASGNFSYSAFRGMWSRVRSRFDTANASQYVTWVLVWMNSHTNPSSNPIGPGQNMVQLYGNDGTMDALVDVVSQQDYIVKGTPAATIATKWLEDLEFLVANDTANRNWSYLHKPQAFTEWGADLGGQPTDRGTNVHRADTIDAIRGILPDLASRNVQEIRYFDAGSNDIDDPPSVDGLAFQALKDATEQGQQAGPVVAAGAALARDGATVTSSSIPFTLPPGWQQGDLAEVWLSTNSNPTMTTVPAGWTLQEGPVANSTVQVAWRYSKVLQAGEPNPTWTISQSVRPSGVMVVLRGIDAATPMHASAALAATASGTSHAAAAVTTTAPQAHLLTVWLTRWADASGNGGVNYALPPGTHTTDGSVSVNSGANPGAGGLVAHLTAGPVAAGTYGPYTATVPVAATGICGQVALLPAGTGTGQVALVGVATAAASASATLTVTRPPPTPPAGVVPAVNVQIAPASGPMDPNPVKVDISAYVEPPVIIEGYGHADEFAQVTPTTMRLRLKNHDGRFTGSRPGGPYGTLRLGCPIWVTETYNGVAYPRFAGHVNGWPVDWPVGGGVLAYADIDATDRSKHLGRPGDLRSMLEEEVLRDQPVCYYPLSEPGGARTCGSITASPQGALGVVDFHTGSVVGGTVSIGGASGPGPDNLPAPSFDPASASAGEYLRGKLDTPLGGGTGLTLRASFRTADATAGRTICSWQGLLGGEHRLLLNATGRLQAFHYDPATDRDTRLYDIASPAAYHDDHDHDVAVVETLSGGTLTARVYVDGAQVASTSRPFAGAALPRVARLLVGSDGDAGQLWAGTVSNLAGYNTGLSSTRVATHAKAALDGLAGERTDTRLHRICDWAGIPASDRIFDVGDKTVGGQATAGRQPLEACNEVVSAEQGVLFVNGAGKLVFHRRSRRYNTAAAFTLDAAQPGQVSLPASYLGDDFGLQNDVTVTRTGGSTQRAVNQAAIDGAAGVGLYRNSLDVASATDTDALAVAQWRVGNYGFPLPRLPALTVSLARLHALGNTSLVTALLAADISTVVHLQGLPAQAPAATDDQVIEGWTEVLGQGVWAVAFNTSPHSVDTVAVVGTAVVGASRVAL